MRVRYNESPLIAQNLLLYNYLWDSTKKKHSNLTSRLYTGILYQQIGVYQNYLVGKMALNIFRILLCFSGSAGFVA
jgi:hypothetical protein